MASNGIAKPPGEDNDALRRHKWLAVLINKLSRKINNYEVPSDTLDELNIPRQIADIAVGMCWALSPDEYEDIRVSTMQALENGHDDSHEQHKYIALHGSMSSKLAQEGGSIPASVSHCFSP